MKNELIPAGGITRKQQAFYAKGGKGGSSSSVVNNETIIQYKVVLEIKVVAGQDIIKGCGYCIRVDEKAYLSTALSTDDRECTMIAASNAVQGTEASFYLTGIGTIDVASFTPGAPVYLRNGVVNISSQILSEKTAQEDVIQQIGTAISETQFIIEIESPIFYE